jgi:hypothetical protein
MFHDRFPDNPASQAILINGNDYPKKKWQPFDLQNNQISDESLAFKSVVE